VTYAPNRVAGQWRAHGRYIERESATRDEASAGFDAEHDSIDVSRELQDWQVAGDPRLWKVIISPEFGERLDLQKLTRQVLARMEADLGTRLQWVGVAHFNTEHPHVHVALRGVRDDGAALDLRRDYVRSGIREIAEDACTTQLGIRTEQDAAMAGEKEIDQHRFTTLDRMIKRLGAWKESDDPSSSVHFVVSVDVAGGDSGTFQRIDAQHLSARLNALRKMGLAEPLEPGMWRVRNDFDVVLRAMQRATDRQKVLAAHGALLSDERLQIVVTDARRVDELAGRVVLHGEEEDGRRAGQHYLLLEGTNGVVHMTYYTSEMEAARRHGLLRVNSFVQTQRKYERGKPQLEINDLGDSEALLKNKRYIQAVAAAQMRKGSYPYEGVWSGWLGRYQKALSEAAGDLRSRGAGVPGGRDSSRSR
jgi:type IV secretory pathway VirD2 relaxase